MKITVVTGEGTYEKRSKIIITTTTGDSRSPVTTKTSLTVAEVKEVLRLAIDQPDMFYQD